jgi:hypothetical protein
VLGLSTSSLTAVVLVLVLVLVFIVISPGLTVHHSHCVSHCEAIRERGSSCEVAGTAITILRRATATATAIVGLLCKASESPEAGDTGLV